MRKPAFGPASDHVRHLGHDEVPASLDAGSDDVVYNEPGRTAALGGPEAPAFSVFRSDVPTSARDDVTLQKQQMTYAAGHRS